MAISHGDSRSSPQLEHIGLSVPDIAKIDDLDMARAVVEYVQSTSDHSQGDPIALKKSDVFGFTILPVFNEIDT